MENNKNNENSIQKQVESKSSINSVLVVIIIILVILLGIAGYFLFIKKGDSGNEPTNAPPSSQTDLSGEKDKEQDKDETSTTPITPSNETTNKLAANTTYTSRDGKDTFTITKIDEKDGTKYIRAKYKNMMYTFYVGDYSYEEDQFLAVEGEPDEGGGGQCNSSGVLLNLKTKTLERISATGQFYYGVIKGNNGYFYKEGYCLSGYDTTIYDSNWKKLGRLIGEKADSQGNIYVFLNGKVTKYNTSGNKLSETSTSAKYTGPGLIHNNILYYLGQESCVVYLYNNSTGEKFKISDTYVENDEVGPPDKCDERIVQFTGLDVTEGIAMSLENNKILIKYDNYDEWNYSFNINTKQITKIGN